jgi:uncharacterized protein (DUF2267 family)
VVSHQVDVVARHLLHLGGRLHGLSYRLRAGHPDPEASGAMLADRIRSSLGSLEKRLDVPHVHVMAEGHVALLHGEVGTEEDADEIEAAVAAQSGVLGVESYLHIGLAGGDTRPSAGKAAQPPSNACLRLIDAATGAGLDPATARPVVRGILATFAERLPAGERDQVSAHLPADVRTMFTPPRRIRHGAPVRTVPALVARIAATTSELPLDNALEVTRAVVRELRALVPEEIADVAAVLPTDLRELWMQEPAD